MHNSHFAAKKMKENFLNIKYHSNSLETSSRYVLFIHDNDSSLWAMNMSIFDFWKKVQFFPLKGKKLTRWHFIQKLAQIVGYGQIIIGIVWSGPRRWFSIPIIIQNVSRWKNRNWWKNFKIFSLPGMFDKTSFFLSWSFLFNIWVWYQWQNIKGNEKKNAKKGVHGNV